MIGYMSETNCDGRIELFSPSSKSGKFWVFALQVINSEA